jgi:hypothetical protein
MIGVFIYHPILILFFMNSVSKEPLYVILFWLAMLFTGRVALWWWKLYGRFWDGIKIMSRKRETQYQILKEMQARLKRRFVGNGLL